MRPIERPALCSRVAHHPSLRRGATRGLRALVSPQMLTGGLTELAWVSAHALLYPLGTRTEQLRPDGRYRPGERPRRPRAVRRRPAGRAHPGAARARVRRQPLDLRRDAPQPPPPRLRVGLHAGTTARCSPTSPRARDDLGRHIERICEQTGHDRIHVVGHSLGGLHRPVPRAEAGRRPPRREPGDPRHAAPGVAVGARAARRRWSASCARARRCCASSTSRRPAAAPRSRRSTATSTRSSSPPAPGAASTPTSPPATCSCAASATCRCRSTGRCVDEVAATLAGRSAGARRPPGRPRPSAVASNGCRHVQTRQRCLV